MQLPTSKDNSFLQSPRNAVVYALKPYRARFTVMILLMVLGNCLVYFLPYLLKIIADKVVGAHSALSLNDFLPILYIIGTALIVQEASFRIAHYLENYFVVRVYDRITTAMFEFLLNRPTAYFEEKFSGEMTRRVEQIGSAIKFLTAGFPWEIGWPVLALIMSSILLFSSHIWLGTVFLVWLVFFSVSSYFLLRMQFSLSQNLSEKQGELSGTLVDVFSNVSLVHTFGAHEHEFKHYRKFMDDVVEVDTRERHIALINKFQQGLSLIVLSMSLIVTSVILFTKGAITIGDFVIVGSTISTLVGVVFTTGEMLIRGIREYGEMKNALESLNTDIVPVKNGESVLTINQATINFEHISFSSIV